MSVELRQNPHLLEDDTRKEADPTIRVYAYQCDLCGLTRKTSTAVNDTRCPECRYHRVIPTKPVGAEYEQQPQHQQRTFRWPTFDRRHIDEFDA